MNAFDAEIKVELGEEPFVVRDARRQVNKAIHALLADCEVSHCEVTEVLYQYRICQIGHFDTELLGGYRASSVCCLACFCMFDLVLGSTLLEDG